MRNLSRSLLVERLGGLAVSGELNVPSLPSLAIVQVFDDNIDEDEDPFVPQGLAERSGLKGEVLGRAAPSSTSQVGAQKITSQVGAQNNNTK